MLIWVSASGEQMRMLCIVKIYGMQLKSIIYYLSALMVPILLEDNDSNFNWLFKISPVSDSC